MKNKPVITEDWYVIFTDSNHKSWFMSILQPGFKHVYAMKKTSGGFFWMIVDPCRTHIDIRQEMVSDYPHPRLYAGDEAVILPIRATINGSKRRSHLCHINCVEVVKGLLGIKSFFTWTPWMLYKYLTRTNK